MSRAQQQPTLPTLFRSGVRRYIPVRPTPLQAAFLWTPNKEAFFGGAAGGGKSEALLMASLQHVDRPDYAAVLVRKNFPLFTQAGGLIERSHDWLGPTGAVWNGADHQWRFPSGATLSFRHLQDKDAELTFQGSEFQFIGIDELTDIEERQYRFLSSRLRRRQGSEIPTRMRAASNPWGPGLEWVRRWFIIEARKEGRVFIPAHLEDNPHLDREDYEATLRNLPPLEYRALRHGDWTIVPEGGMFYREWFDGRFVQDEELPSGLRLCRFWDLAATEPRRGSDPDYTAGVLLGRSKDNDWYVIDVVRLRATPHKVQQRIAATAEKDLEWARDRGFSPPAIRMEMEPGSAGKGIVALYRRDVLTKYDFAGIASTGSKQTRAAPLVSKAEAGDLFVCRGPWNTAFLDELTAFPLGGKDDQVDALSGAFGFLAEHPTSFGVPTSVGYRPNPFYSGPVTLGENWGAA
jgi:predicted phage terminase large subunit-like protein